MKLSPLKYLFLLALIILFSCNQKKTEPFTFVQMCDTQLGMGGYEHDVQTFTQAVEIINEMEPDFVLICGDLVHHATDSSFNDFIEIRNGFSMPSYCAAGNHDIGNNPTESSLEKYRNVIGDDYYNFQHKGYSFTVCNTELWKVDCGEESEKHNQWFMETVKNTTGEDQPGFVMGHYPLYLDEPEEEDKYFNIPLNKRKELLSLFEQQNIKAYLSGHAHRTIINDYNGIQMVTGETTSKNFDEAPMGFRVWNVTADSIWHEFMALD